MNGQTVYGGANEGSSKAKDDDGAIKRASEAVSERENNSMNERQSVQRQITPQHTMTKATQAQNLSTTTEKIHLSPSDQKQRIEIEENQTKKLLHQLYRKLENKHQINLKTSR